MSREDHGAMSRAARTYYEQHFTMDALVTELEQMLQSEINKQEC